MAKLFTEILDEAAKRGFTNTRAVDATNWLRETSQKVVEADANPVKVISDTKSKLVSSPEIGKLYLFNYNPKTKDRLPYYDRFPLIFPFNMNSDGFHGINMHYLPYTYRAKLMDALYDLEEEESLQISYEILTSISRLRYFRPCVKRYLNSYLKSRFLEVSYNQWEVALFLPLERFEKATKQQVFRQTTQQIRGQ